MDRTFLDLNWASTVVNTLIVAFFVVALGGAGIGIYAASVLKKREKDTVAPADAKSE